MEAKPFVSFASQALLKHSLLGFGVGRMMTLVMPGFSHSRIGGGGVGEQRCASFERLSRVNHEFTGRFPNDCVKHCPNSRHNCEEALTVEQRRVDKGKPQLVRKPPKLRLWKRLTDFGVGAVLIVAAAPVILVIAGILELAGRPVFEGQVFIGANGEVFRRWHFCCKRFDTIRKTGLDGLPQLFNVLNGTMSFVGPQPLSERQVRSRTIDEQVAYFACRPGLTGLWQSGGRNNLRLEQRYATECSPWLDFTILVRTLVTAKRESAS
jgi:lipopolysaccharide/colanic/teichoic acid biosynthesis glycosyltransferase